MDVYGRTCETRKTDKTESSNERNDEATQRQHADYDYRWDFWYGIVPRKAM